MLHVFGVLSAIFRPPVEALKVPEPLPAAVASARADAAQLREALVDTVLDISPGFSPPEVVFFQDAREQSHAVPQLGLQPETLRNFWAALGEYLDQGFEVRIASKVDANPHGPRDLYELSPRYWMFDAAQEAAEKAACTLLPKLEELAGEETRRALTHGQWTEAQDRAFDCVRQIDLAVQQGFPEQLGCRSLLLVEFPVVRGGAASGLRLSTEDLITVEIVLAHILQAQSSIMVPCPPEAVAHEESYQIGTERVVLSPRVMIPDPLIERQLRLLRPMLRVFPSRNVVQVAAVFCDE